MYIKDGAIDHKSVGLVDGCLRKAVSYKCENDDIVPWKTQKEIIRN